MNLKNVNLKSLRAYKSKLKELKTWVQVRSPKPLQSALSYTLDWLSPELLGSGFRMIEVSDFSMKGLIPKNSSNLDSNGEIHQGLVLNASLELSRTCIDRHLPENLYQITSSDVQISKKQKWGDEITLNLNSSESVFDHFFSELQSNKKTTIEFQIQVQSDSKKMDLISIKLTCDATNLLT